MYELKNSSGYFPYNTSINPDELTWKSYPSEVVFNLSEAVISGTGDSNDYMDQVISRLQLRFNSELAQIGSLKSCQNDDFIDVAQETSEGFLDLRTLDEDWNPTGKEAVKCSEVLWSLTEIINYCLDWLIADPD